MIETTKENSKIYILTVKATTDHSALINTKRYKNRQ
jgi:hypothetical protein